MKWFTHKAVGAAVALAAGANAGTLVAVLLGSIMPDLVDRAIARGNKSLWRRIHRQSSHWFGWYVLIILLGFLGDFTALRDVLSDTLAEVLGTSIPASGQLTSLFRSISLPGVTDKNMVVAGQIGRDMVVWLGIGGLLHVLLDALNPMRVPVFPFGGKIRFGINLVGTGTWKENVFLVLALGAIALQFDRTREVFAAVLKAIL